MQTPEQSRCNRSKSLDGNHLLNFRQSNYPCKPKRKENKHQPHTKSKLEQKARHLLSSDFFLHCSASHRFLLTTQPLDGIERKEQNYSNPDTLVSWDAVRLVVSLVPSESRKESSLSSFASESCPICLDSFASPRITRCGHVYCLPCLMRYFISCQKPATNATKAILPRKSRQCDFYSECPCCFRFISLSELRPVEFISFQPPESQGRVPVTMTFQKLHKRRGSFTPFIPSVHSWGNSYKKGRMHSIPTSTDPEAQYSRYSYIDRYSYVDHLDSDINSLQFQYKELTHLRKDENYVNETTDGLYYISMALQMVKDIRSRVAEECLEEKINPQVGFNNDVKALLQKTVFEKTEKEKDITKFSKDTKNDRSQRRSKKGNNIERLKDTKYADDDCIHFYQSVDGQLCFLSNFNMSCLSHDYSQRNPKEQNIEVSDKANTHSTLPPFPDLIHGQVLDSEIVHLTPEIRKRMTFLSHLPLYTDIIFVELNLGIVLSVKNPKKTEIDLRKKKRKAKRNSEKKLINKANIKEEIRIQKQKEQVHLVDENDQFFHSTLINTRDEKLQLNGDDFGPVLQSTGSHTAPMDNSSICRKKRETMNFRSACVSRVDHASLDSENVMSFPELALSSSEKETTTSVGHNKWNHKPKKINQSSSLGTEPVLAQDSSTIRGRRKKKILLFSTR